MAQRPRVNWKKLDVFHIIWINSRNVKVTQNAIINSRWLPPHLHNETAEFGRCELGLVFLLGNDGPFIDEMQLNVGIGSVLVSPTTKNRPITSVTHQPSWWNRPCCKKSVPHSNIDHNTPSIYRSARVTRTLCFAAIHYDVHYQCYCYHNVVDNVITFSYGVQLKLG